MTELYCGNTGLHGASYYSRIMREVCCDGMRSVACLCRHVCAVREQIGENSPDL